MTPIRRLLVRLVTSVALVDAASLTVLVTFGPRWLLLDERVVPDVTRTEVIVAVALTIGQLLVMLGLALGNRRPLVDLAGAEPSDLLSLFSLPSRIVYARAALAVVFGCTTLFARPPGVDSYTQAALVLLHLTLVSTATLPLYVAARDAVGEVLERAPVAVSREAVGLLVRLKRATRLERRFLVALAAPVALVAVGASLLVYAHGRSADEEARRAEAQAFVAGTLDLVEGRTDGRLAAVSKGRELGFDVLFARKAAASSEADSAVVPLEDGDAVVRYRVASPGLATALWLGAALIAVALAALAGSRIGAGLSNDVSLATRELDAMGVVDVLRGSRVFRDAYFQSVRRLASGVEELGGVFREFAAAQERAIVARAAAERTRAMLLATMSHDLKGPLNGILGFAGLLEKGKLTDGQRENVVIIRQRGRELLYLIETVLDAARLEAASMDLARHEAPSSDVVMAAVLDARELLQGSAREVDEDIADDLPVVEVDSARVVQALVSLAHAASRISDKGPIRVRAAKADDGALRVVIEGEMPSLSPDESARLAESDATTSVKLAGRRPMSLSLGISIARAILEAHGGSLEVTVAGGQPMRLIATIPPAAASATMKMNAPPEMKGE